MKNVKILCGDNRAVLAGMRPASVHCCVTSPPYWGLRDYQHDDQLGLEKTPEEYVANMVAVFAEVWRVLRPDGTLWLNLGDSYSTGSSGQNFTGKTTANVCKDLVAGAYGHTPRPAAIGLKPKELVGIPWRVAFALQAAGWYLRSEIIWSKNNSMPESVTDRPTKAHEQIFLLTKQPTYYYDAEAIKERQASEPKAHRVDQRGELGINHHGQAGRITMDTGYANKRSVWQVPVAPYKGAHFATFPPKLILPCILAGTSEHGCCPRCGAPWVRQVARQRTATRPARESKLTPGVVLDPFAGSGTTLAVAARRNRRAIGIELNPAYIQLIEARVKAAIATKGLGLL